jgi:hypothetical protein
MTQHQKIEKKIKKIKKTKKVTCLVKGIFFFQFFDIENKVGFSPKK